ncbi:hypothetical protein L1887_55350 [Cichorium endivia]|nr:hypothetical protein L1887_55350 [Cichorium endivia]
MSRPSASLAGPVISEECRRRWRWEAINTTRAIRAARHAADQLATGAHHASLGERAFHRSYFAERESLSRPSEPPNTARQRQRAFAEIAAKRAGRAGINDEAARERSRCKIVHSNTLWARRVGRDANARGWLGGVQQGWAGQGSAVQPSAAKRRVLGLGFSSSWRLPRSPARAILRQRRPSTQSQITAILLYRCIRHHHSSALPEQPMR